MIIPITKLSINAVIPTNNSGLEAGYDLYALEDDWLFPLQRKLIKTGISIAIPPGFYGRIAPRSGLAWKYGIDVMAGVIDSTYRGEIGVVLVNLNPESAENGTFRIEKGMRIAQIIIERCHQVEWQVVDNLDETSRGAGGFGSTGK